MKKRVVTESQYRTPLADIKLMTEEEKVKARASNKAWRDSNKYRIEEFPKNRYYVVLAKHKESGVIYGYFNNHPNTLSANSLHIFTSDRYNFKNRLFTLREYRQDGRGVRNANHYCKKMRNVKGSDKFEFFVARIGSKNCPVKVQLTVAARKRGYARFISKMKGKELCLNSLKT